MDLEQRSKFKFLWITDPWETLDHANDATLRLIQESVSLGYINFWSDVRTISISRGRVSCNSFFVSEVMLNREKSGFNFGKMRKMELTSVDSIQFRVDPPVDSKFLQSYQLVMFSLESSLKKNPNLKIQIVNNPVSILMSDKIEGALIEGAYPDTIVSSNPEQLLKFAQKHRRIILKPLNFCQGLDVRFIDLSDALTRNSLLETLKNATSNSTTLIVAQEFLNEVQDGEIRLWFLDGILIGFAKKILCGKSYIINTDAGDKVIKTNLTPKQIQLSKEIGATLSFKGIRLAAIDLINDKITDYNFISPGLLVQVEKAMGRNLSKLIINRLANIPVYYSSVWHSQSINKLP